MNKEFFRSLNTEKFPVSDEHQEVKQRSELIQRPAKDLFLKDGWYVDIDIETHEGVTRFIRVEGKDKFDAIAKANFVYDCINERSNEL